MATQTVAPALYRREYYYFLFFTFGLLAIALMCGLTGWALTPRPLHFDAGPIETFSPVQPNLIYVRLKDDSSTPIWIVATEQGWLAFDGRAPVEKSNCRYKWVPVNNRFEDPCSGFKWTMNGLLLSYPPGQRQQWQDLAQYPVRVVDDHLVIHMDKVISGQTYTAKPDTVVCLYTDISCVLVIPTP